MCGCTCGLVVWKDEGRTGPATHFTAEARHEVERPGRPVLPPPSLPFGVTSHGWMSRSAARRLARQLRADFVEV